MTIEHEGYSERRGGTMTSNPQAPASLEVAAILHAWRTRYAWT
jgi:hypothetical protein